MCYRYSVKKNIFEMFQCWLLMDFYYLILIPNSACKLQGDKMPQGHFIHEVLYMSLSVYTVQY